MKSTAGLMAAGIMSGLGIFIIVNGIPSPTRLGLTLVIFGACLAAKFWNT